MEERDAILFEAYLSGTLSAPEREELEQRLERDTGFRDAFGMFRETRGYLEAAYEKEAETEAFRETVRQASGAYFGNKNGQYSLHSPARRRIKPWQIAVAATVLVLLGIFFSPRIAAPSYGDYAHYPQISLAVRGDGDAVLQQAEQAFNTGDYAGAAASFERLPEEERSQPGIMLYHAISLVELEEYKRADGMFETLFTGASAFKYDAMWYGGLSLLKQDRKEACKTLLGQIPESSGHFAESRELLGKL
ncbi:hypothetical protein [Sinomicrobium soli]|uniref:hypothetical protein n=1 Tax=Sinomicrobium sp. N-1-3-6 TaxID=2219864 RepID=UPI000DCEECFF|nr:hypothetical protein [Sinomicrobium sp. N-1-3-6]RAV30539.1 hypothetical protein DN748_03315 [Sinomicrobium sp. N-1-3-6]